MDSVFLICLLMATLSLTRTASQDPDDPTLSYKFPLDFYISIARSLSVEENIAASPFSAQAALAMTFIGARGQTRSEIGNALGFQKDTDAITLASQFRGVNADQKDYLLQSANGLFVDKTYTINPDFRSIIQNNFGANISAVDFSTQADQARQQINAFVKSSTRSRIQDLFAVGSIRSDTRLILVNAVYFKADWQNQFDASRTSSQPFSLLNGKHVMVPLMNYEGSVFYTESEDLNAKIVELPYKREMSMIVILPRNETKFELQRLERLTLNPTSLNQALQGLFRRKVKLFLPKFRVNIFSDISRDFKTLKITTAFSNQADFSGISSQKNLRISKVIQKVFVEVDEKGTEAAAATGIQIVLLSAVIEPTEPPVFRADHPFIFLIRHKTTKSVIFMGRVSDPSI